MTTRLLILGATGMLGHTLMRELDEGDSLDVYGSARNVSALRGTFSDRLLERVIPDIDALNMESVRQLLRDLQPDVVINCIGVIKQNRGVEEAVGTITVNSLFPHALAELCAGRGTRLIHVSTDCVFSGNRGNYVETDDADPGDLYGRSKLLGEVASRPALTLRTSFIGHELGSSRSLIDWFLSQAGVVHGYTRAVYSGITTTEFARLLGSIVLPRTDLAGLFHVASTPISKYELLRLIAREYRWDGQIIPFDDFACDRSLSADAFFSLTGYRPRPWPEMIAELRRSVSPGWAEQTIARSM